MAHKNSLFLGQKNNSIYILQFKWNLQLSDEETSEVVLN